MLSKFIQIINCKWVFWCNVTGHDARMLVYYRIRRYSTLNIERYDK